MSCSGRRQVTVHTRPGTPDVRLFLAGISDRACRRPKTWLRTPWRNGLRARIRDSLRGSGHGLRMPHVTTEYITLSSYLRVIFPSRCTGSVKTGGAGVATVPLHGATHGAAAHHDADVGRSGGGGRGAAFAGHDDGGCFRTYQQCSSWCPDQPFEAWPACQTDRERQRGACVIGRFRR